EESLNLGMPRSQKRSKKKLVLFSPSRKLLTILIHLISVSLVRI
ncbi:unnamed protein product, partial [Allacma fusca]